MVRVHLHPEVDRGIDRVGWRNRGDLLLQVPPQVNESVEAVRLRPRRAVGETLVADSELAPRVAALGAFEFPGAKLRVDALGNAPRCGIEPRRSSRLVRLGVEPPQRGRRAFQRHRLHQFGEVQAAIFDHHGRAVELQRAVLRQRIPESSA